MPDTTQTETHAASDCPKRTRVAVLITSLVGTLSVLSLAAGTMLAIIGNDTASSTALTLASQGVAGLLALLSNPHKE